MRPKYKNSEAKIQREISRWETGDLLVVKETFELFNDKRLTETYLKKNSRCLFLGEIKEENFWATSKFWVKVTNGKKSGWVPARVLRLVTRKNKLKLENE